MKKSQLMQIAQDNIKLVETTNTQIPCTIEVKYKECKECPIIINESGPMTKIMFREMKSDECAIHCIETGITIGPNIAILNFASRHRHGGKYIEGAKAQEEDLCRTIPHLYPSILQKTYPLKQCHILITPDLRIMRDSEKYNLFNQSQIYIVNVVSAAAQNLKFELYDEDIVTRTLINVYASTKYILPHVDTLILGAWGCGAYRNNPYTIARIMDSVGKKYGGMYKNIFYSIPPGPNILEFKSIIVFDGQSSDSSDDNHSDQDQDQYQDQDQDQCQASDNKIDEDSESDLIPNQNHKHNDENLNHTIKEKKIDSMKKVAKKEKTKFKLNRRNKDNIQ